MSQDWRERETCSDCGEYNVHCTCSDPEPPEVLLCIDDLKNLQWCVLYDGATYPFGPDNLARELAEWAAPRIESGKDEYAPARGFVPVHLANSPGFRRAN
jgi:hypothetical protein